jgi:hypothetical protein
MKPGLKIFYSVRELAEDIVSRMEEKDKQFLRETVPNRKAMGHYHFSVGMGIRNNYGLWDESHPLTQQWFYDRKSGSKIHLKDGVDCHPNHPDNISGRILEHVWDICNGK